MSDILIEKTPASLSAYFAMSRPSSYSTPYYLKKGDEIIPFWGLRQSYDIRTLKYNSLAVYARSADGKQTFPVTVEDGDEIYHTLTRFSLSGVLESYPDTIYSYEKLTLETLSAFADPFSSFNINLSASPSIRINKNTPYKNTNTDKDLIKFHLNEKLTALSELPDQVNGTKNLLYFTLFNDPKYVSVIELCLKVIHNYTPNKNFDVLIFTDDPTKTLISKLDIVSNFNIEYVVLDLVTDPVVASAQKLRISEYSKINDYNKILFLDVDVLCLGDLNSLFNENISDNVLDVVKVAGGSPVSSNHSLKYFTVEELQYILDNKVRPFNAGHFMFNNTLKMQEHFKIVYWLYNIWPGAYFYEQSFMNYYFNILLKNTSFNVLDRYIQIGLEDKQGASIVHFIGGNSKIDAMNAYLLSKNICL